MSLYRIEFHTAHYEFAHGKKPRGAGYWAMIFHVRGAQPETIFYRGTYSEAKKMARYDAEFRGCTRVEVGS